MATATVSPAPPKLVGSILRSLQLGDLNALESALERAAQVSSSHPVISADLAERLELINAIACEMRADVRRSRGGINREVVDAYVPLLKNLRVNRRPERNSF